MNFKNVQNLRKNYIFQRYFFQISDFYKNLNILSQAILKFSSPKKCFYFATVLKFRPFRHCTWVDFFKGGPKPCINIYVCIPVNP